MSLKAVATIGLRVGERKPYGFDLTKFCANYFVLGEIYEAGEVVRPRELEDGGRGPTGLEYLVTVGGQCTSLEPTWPRTVGDVVSNGSVTFIAQAISNVSLKKTITSSVWAAPTGVTIEDDSTETTDGEQKTAAFLLAAAAFAVPAEVVNTVTFSDGHDEKFVIKISKVIVSA